MIYGSDPADGTATRSFARMSVHERVEEIYVAERDNIYVYLLYCGVPPQRAQDLAQDSFLKLYQKLSRGEPVENPRAWVYRVAHNSAARYHRREPVFDEIGANILAVEFGPDPELALVERQRRAALAKAIRDLSPRQRNCLHLRVQGMGYREIAETIGISTSAVGEFLRRAVARLKEVLNG
jgi:RNA polymerase sigma-70 factor (ECF subfamily)